MIKKALIISTKGGVSANSVTKSLANTLPEWGFNKCYQLPIVVLSWNDYKPSEKHIKKAYKIFRSFYMDLKSKKLHSHKIRVLIPFNLFQAMCEEYSSRTEFETQDRVFGKQYGGMRHAPGVPMPIFKKIFGRLIFQIGKYLSPKMIVTYKK